MNFDQWEFISDNDIIKVEIFIEKLGVIKK